MPVVSCRKSYGGDRLGEKNAHRLNKCSASGVRSVMDIAQVPEMGAGRSGSPGCSLSSWSAFSANRVRYSSTLSVVPQDTLLHGRWRWADGQVRRPAAWLCSLYAYLLPE